MLAVRTSTVAAAWKKLQWSLPPISCHNNFFNIKSCSFFVFKNKQTRPRFRVVEKFITCLPPEKPRGIAFYPISPQVRAKKVGIVNKVYWYPAVFMTACKKSGSVPVMVYFQPAGSKPFGYLQSRPRRWTCSYQEQIQLKVGQDLNWWPPRGLTILLTTWPRYPPIENVMIAILKSFILFFISYFRWIATRH